MKCQASDFALVNQMNNSVKIAKMSPLANLFAVKVNSVSC